MRNLSPRSPKKDMSPQPNSLHSAESDTKFEFKPPADTANLTIKERIALMQGKKIGGETIQPSAVKPPVAKKPQSFRRAEESGKAPIQDPPLTNSSLMKTPIKAEQNHIPKGPPLINTTTNKTQKEEQKSTVDEQKSLKPANPGPIVGKSIYEQKVCRRNSMPGIIYCLLFSVSVCMHL